MLISVVGVVKQNSEGIAIKNINRFVKYMILLTTAGSVSTFISLSTSVFESSP